MVVYFELTVLLYRSLKISEDLGALQKNHFTILSITRVILRMPLRSAQSKRLVLKLRKIQDNEMERQEGYLLFDLNQENEVK